ncbi:BglG family transcription antiterminator [Staphylococcus felis]|uniref:BglG family transcription antiterminator n=1 Tax=Staphylococcus felis TaxID=46127 RepID=UPI000E23796B|nr:BglG family transcription antiterminator [Staphylococcus felis]REH83903.1 PTS mannose transporter subunit IIA [Staphylococcus felis]REH88709.1 PTS mannose transporter subunit IIA [Staphylococcus felis]
MIGRQIQLVQLFLKQQSAYLTSDEISKKLQVSNRTARSDIQVINQLFLKDVIVSVPAKGYQFNLKRYDIETIASQLEHHLQRDAKLLVAVGYHLLMSNEVNTIQDIVQHFNFTKKEAMDYVERIQAWCETFHIKLMIKQRKGIVVEGSKTHLTNAILHLNQLAGDSHHVETLILNELPQAHVQTIRHLLKQQLDEYDMRYASIQIEQLLIHLILLIKRPQQKGDTLFINTKAKQIAHDVIQAVNTKLGYHLTEDTVTLFSFLIGYHFNQFDLGFQKHFIESYVNRLIEDVEKRVEVSFSHDTLLQENLYSHFSRTYLRVTQSMSLTNPLTQDIKARYPFLFNMIYESIQHLAQYTEIVLSEDEIAFLTIHFQAAVERFDVQTVRVAIGCYYGLGVSQLLETKIAQMNQNIRVVDTFKYNEIKHYDWNHIDVLITTHDVERDSIPNHVDVLKVSPFFSEEDQQRLSVRLRNQLQKHKGYEIDRVKLHVVSTDESFKRLSDVFEMAQDILNTYQAIHTSYMETALERERMASTYIGQGIAIPHGDPDKVAQSYVLIFRSRRGIYWKTDRAHLIIFLAIADIEIQQTRHIMQTIAKMDKQDVESFLEMDDHQFEKHMSNLLRDNCH